MIEKKIFRHPEKRNNPDRPMKEKPSWIKVKVSLKKNYHDTLDIIKKHNLVTVCEEAGCPNIGECWNKRHATFMIMGDICTRGCAFCNVKTGRPKALDPLEPLRIADAVSKLQLLHTVITSVDRDDLIDGGAHHFVQVVSQIRKIAPHTTIEILTPDFQGKEESVDTILKEPPDVFNHNLETVPRLYPKIRPGARYFTSLELLYRAKCKNPLIFTKTGLMVGLGETQEEVLQVMDDCRAADIDFLTIGQYLQPTPKHAPVSRFVTPDEFNLYAKFARAKGFLMVSSSPLTRSSYMAGEDFHKLRIAREKKFLYT